MSKETLVSDLIRRKENLENIVEDLIREMGPKTSAKDQYIEMIEQLEERIANILGE